MNGTLINYYIHCKRQCYLFYNKLNLEDNSELVAIGRELHENKTIDRENANISIDNISIDKITEDYVVEIKKSNADVDAATWQLYYYLYVLKSKKIMKKGKLEFIESNKSKKTQYIELSEDKESELVEIIKNIKEMANSNKIPPAKRIKGCHKCAYFEYCFI